MQKKGNHKKKKDDWPLQAFLLTVILSLVLSFFSQTTMMGLPIYLAVFILLLIILIGIVFDMIGVAVAAQNISDFTAMASKRIHGAKRAIALLKNASRVSSVCNDLVGDICGIISGAMGASISIRLISVAASLTESDLFQVLVGCALSALIAAITVSGKAIGKKMALTNSRQVVFLTARALSFFDKR